MIKASILVVEDEAVIAEDLADKVRQLGYSVVAICARGEQAVELAGRLGPDLVLMDIQLDGDLDGVEAAREIRQRLDLPVIYLTAHADAPTLARAKVTEPFAHNFLQGLNIHSFYWYAFLFYLIHTGQVIT